MTKRFNPHIFAWAREHEVPYEEAERLIGNKAPKASAAAKGDGCPVHPESMSARGSRHRKQEGGQ